MEDDHGKKDPVNIEKQKTEKSSESVALKDKKSEKKENDVSKKNNGSEKTRRSNRIDTFVGENSLLTGNIKVNGCLRVDGDFIGNITETDYLLVSKTGRIEADIEVDKAIIGGIIKGNLVAKKEVVLLSSGVFLGNITVPSLSVEPGTLIDGNISIV